MLAAMPALQTRRSSAFLLVAAGAFLVPSVAHAEDVAHVEDPASKTGAPDAAPIADEPDVPEDVGNLVLDTGRIPKPKPDPQLLRIHVRGELQLRGQVQRSFPLDVSTSALNTHPGALEDSIGQNAFVTQWLRVTRTRTRATTAATRGPTCACAGSTASGRAPSASSAWAR